MFLIFCPSVVPNYSHFYPLGQSQAYKIAMLTSYNPKGELLANAKRNEEALQVFEEAIRMEGYSDFAKLNLAMVIRGKLTEDSGRLVRKVRDKRQLRSA